ncbi:hypothetical protein [Halobaculum sp. MBLA0143]|uniref:hypothetical protein n=1 Tax=Halobaculum sp. MBLA0143 TaxID=3079933 RepID=UPI003524AFD8
MSTEAQGDDGGIVSRLTCAEMDHDDYVASATALTVVATVTFDSGPYLSGAMFVAAIGFWAAAARAGDEE